MTVLTQINLTLALSEQAYLEQLPRAQALVGILAREAAMQQRPVIVVFEGWDAAGKGGCIKRLTEAMDPRGYIVYPMGAAEHEDKAHHYLYRFWQRLPEPGRAVIFDRSWYGRVLGDRVDGRCTEAEWKRAYLEINQFERQLVDAGTILFKFWLHITPEEQLQRLQTRAAAPQSEWRLTPDDWRNHALWAHYEPAVEEMLLKTSTIIAPWTIIEAMDQQWARVRVLRTVADTLARELKYDPDSADARLKKAIRKRPQTDPRVSEALEVGEEEAEQARDGGKKKAGKEKT